MATFGQEHDVFADAIGWDTYEELLHLFAIPRLMEDLDRFIDTPSTPPQTTIPTLMERLDNPSHISVSSSEGDPDLPGEDWMKFDAGRPAHYRFIFPNEQGRPELAKYIRYLVTDKGVVHQGTRGKGEAVYGQPLHALAFPTPNFNRPGIKDTDHTIFHPACAARIVVDDALESLADPGVIADVHRLRDSTNALE